MYTMDYRDLIVCRFMKHTVLPFGPLVLKGCVTEFFFFISQPKHMLWVLKRTVSMIRFF